MCCIQLQKYKKGARARATYGAGTARKTRLGAETKVLTTNEGKANGGSGAGWGAGGGLTVNLKLGWPELNHWEFE